MSDAKPMKTLMHTSKIVSKDENRKKLDKKIYRSMIGSLFFLISNRLNIMHNMDFTHILRSLVLSFLHGSLDTLWKPLTYAYVIRNIIISHYKGLRHRLCFKKTRYKICSHFIYKTIRTLNHLRHEYFI